MNNYCTVQVFHNNQWKDIAQVTLREPTNKGWNAATSTDYLNDYIFDHLGQQDAAALSWQLVVDFESKKYPTWPPFLVDLLPQGYGRRSLLKQLGLPQNAEKSGDWPLVLSGSGNPIGNLRIKEAAEYLRDKTSNQIKYGFTKSQVAIKDGNFLETMADQYGVFLSGSSGVQGEWPKLLMAEGYDGLFYLDHCLPDSFVKKHWLVKFRRGLNSDLALIFDNEHKYMQLAKYLGLNVHAPITLIDDAMFIERFDREVIGKQSDQVVLRHAQESILVLCDMAGFEIYPDHEDVIQILAKACTNPEKDILEYLKRDIANLVLGNTDNHGRNTAITRRWNGFVGLTPLFDFAPMFKHPDGIMRTIRWKADASSPNWANIIATIVDLTGLDSDYFKRELKAWVPILTDLPKIMDIVGVDDQLKINVLHRINNVTDQLRAL